MQTRIQKLEAEFNRDVARYIEALIACPEQRAYTSLPQVKLRLSRKWLSITARKLKASLEARRKAIPRAVYRAAARGHGSANNPDDLSPQDLADGL